MTGKANMVELIKQRRVRIENNYNKKDTFQSPKELCRNIYLKLSEGRGTKRGCKCIYINDKIRRYRKFPQDHS